MGAEEEGGGVLGGGVEDRIRIFEKFVGENGKAAMHFGIGSSIRSFSGFDFHQLTTEQ